MCRIAVGEKLGGDREREGISVGGETGWKYCSRINTGLARKKKERERKRGGEKKGITAVKRARRRE